MSAMISISPNAVVFTPSGVSPTADFGHPQSLWTRSLAHLTGETCLETPDGKIVGRAGGPPVIVPAGSPMLLTATGTERRHAITLILHESSKPPATVIHDWTPKGLCKVVILRLR